MVDLILNGLKGGLHVCEIEYPSQTGINGAGDVNFNAKAMPVHPPAFMPGGNIRQPMGCLDRKFLEYLHHLSLRNPQELVDLKAQAPFRMVETVAHRQISVCNAVGPVHRLKKEMLKRKRLELGRIEAHLRIDEL